MDGAVQMASNNGIKRWHQTMASNNGIKRWHKKMAWNKMALYKWHQTESLWVGDGVEQDGHCGFLLCNANGKGGMKEAQPGATTKIECGRHRGSEGCS